MKQSLYKIKEEYLALIVMVEDLEGEITPEIEKELQINEAQLQSKSIAYLSVIKKNTFFVSQLDEEIKRLQGMKKKVTTLNSNLSDRLLDAVKTFGEFKTEFNKFGTRKRETVEIENVNNLPDEFKTIKIVESADKLALKKALKEGIEIEGVSLITHQNLKIN